LTRSLVVEVIEERIEVMSISHSLHEVIQQEITALTHSINSLAENLHRLKSPLVESHDKVPQATTQLDKISQQTEAATNRMLDVIEQITQRDQQIMDRMRGIQTQIGDHPVITEISSIVEMVNLNQNDSYAVMDALQFQDITAQQMDHAASLLEDIEAKLKNILLVIGAEDNQIQNEEPAHEKKVRSYDPHADLFNRKTEQADIDSIFSKTTK
jgi:chemotaxis regulatin CheY-phosphate phosphatase CheZ